VIIHHIEVNDIGTGIKHGLNIVTEAGEISRKN
jgi:hypothetical protein